MGRRDTKQRSSSHQPLPEKTCAACGRRMVWRKKWARHWDEVRYCSDACRGAKVTDADRDLERAIVALLAERAATSSACPSDVARRTSADDWRPLMEPVRRAARRLVARGVVVIKQKGVVVDPSAARGPIRLARGPAFTTGAVDDDLA